MIKKAEISVIIGLIVSIIVSTVSFGYECNKIRNDVIRLHIIANSDSKADQAVKIKVRDALLEYGKEMFSGNVNVDNAQEKLKIYKQYLIETANSVLEENGMNYKSEIYLTKEYFSTRQYEDFTMPAGEYLALKVVLGEGVGKNWWCVMFPPLCLPAASERSDLNVVFTEKGAAIIKNKDNYAIKFKIIEIVEELRQKIDL